MRIIRNDKEIPLSISEILRKNRQSEHYSEQKTSRIMRVIGRF